MKTLEVASDETEVERRGRLVDLCADSFLLGIQLRSTDNFGSPDVLRQRILDLLARFERSARKAGYDSTHVESAKFALVAFLDETILASDWYSKDAWLAQPLQLQLYDRFDAGEEFFVRLEALRKDAAENLDVLEVYHLCMTLGFKGRFQLHEQAKLRYIIEDLYSDLQQAGRTARTLSPNGYRREPSGRARREGPPAWMIFAGVAAFCVLLYLVLSLWITGSASNAVDAIRAVP